MVERIKVIVEKMADDGCGGCWHVSVSGKEPEWCTLPHYLATSNGHKNGAWGHTAAEAINRWHNHRHAGRT